jgi:hypothetical protein
MMALANTKRLVLLVWTVANVALLLLIGGELGWGKKLVEPMPAPVVPPSAPVNIVLPPDYRLPALEKAFAGTLERPLFVPTRRKAPPPPPPPPPAMKKGQFQLLGTIITDEIRAAIVKEVAGAKVRQLELNQTINGLRLEQIEPDKIVFTQYDDREELPLKIQPSSKAPPPGRQDGPQASGQAAPNVQQDTTLPNRIPAARIIRHGSRRTAPAEERVDQ